MSTVSAASTEGSAHLQKACTDACNLLTKLGHKDGALNEGRFQVERPVNKYLVKSCQGLVFQWTFKAGLGLGITHGHGFMIHKTDHKAGTWSAPCFIKFSGGKIGALIGVEQISTVMACMSRNLAENLEHGKHTDIGGSVSAAVWPLGGTEEAMSAEKGSWDTSDLICINVGKGIMLDLSLQGGVMTVDDHANEQCYGSGVTAKDIFAGKVQRPHDMMPLYRELGTISGVGGAGAVLTNA